MAVCLGMSTHTRVYNHIARLNTRATADSPLTMWVLKQACWCGAMASLLTHPMDPGEMDYRTGVAINSLYKEVVDEAGRITTEEVATPTWTHIGEQVIGTMVVYVGLWLFALTFEGFYAKNPACRRYSVWFKNYMGYSGEHLSTLTRRFASPRVPYSFQKRYM
jgi:hypothetical protein